MTKKQTKKSIKKKLEKLVKECVKLRDKNICQRSGQRVDGSNCHASHVIPVSQSTRMAYDPVNLKVLSYHNHINWWHKHPTESGQWFKDKFPERMEYLEERLQETRAMGTIHISEYEEMLESLNAYKKELESEMQRLSSAT